MELFETENYDFYYEKYDEESMKKTKETLYKNQSHVLSFFNRNATDKSRVIIFPTRDSYIKDYEKNPKYTEQVQYKAILRTHNMCLISKNDKSLKNRSDEEYENIITHQLVKTIIKKFYNSIVPEWLENGIAKYILNHSNESLALALKDVEANNNINYNNENFAYLLVSYLIEKNGKDEFLLILKKQELMEALGQETLLKAINYYEEKYANNNVKKR